MDDERLGFDGRFRLHPVAFNPWGNYCGRGVVCSFAAASGWQAAADALRQAGIETYVRAKLFYLKRKRMGSKGPPKSEWEPVSDQELYDSLPQHLAGFVWAERDDRS